MRVSVKTLVGAGVLVALLLAGGISYFASAAPDGLTNVAQELGISSTQDKHALRESPLSGYATKGLDTPALSGAVAGVVGVVVTLGVSGALFAVVRRRRRGSREATR